MNINASADIILVRFSWRHKKLLFRSESREKWTCIKGRPIAMHCGSCLNWAYTYRTFCILSNSWINYAMFECGQSMHIHLLVRRFHINTQGLPPYYAAHMHSCLPELKKLTASGQGIWKTAFTGTSPLFCRAVLPTNQAWLAGTRERVFRVVAPQL